MNFPTHVASFAMTALISDSAQLTEPGVASELPVGDEHAADVKISIIAAHMTLPERFGLDGRDIETSLLCGDRTCGFVQNIPVHPIDSTLRRLT
jgi:hypothetical protein